VRWTRAGVRLQTGQRRWEYSASGYGGRRAGPAAIRDAHPTLRLTTKLPHRVGGAARRALAPVKEATPCCALAFRRIPRPRLMRGRDKMVDDQRVDWRHGLHRQIPDHPWRSYLQRSALTLKGWDVLAAGALLAASTTSLPETPQGEATGISLCLDSRTTRCDVGPVHAGLDREADDACLSPTCPVRTTMSASAAGVYGVRRRKPGRGELASLSGYDNARPVGSATEPKPEQHDVWVDGRCICSRQVARTIPETLWPVLKATGRGSHQTMEGARHAGLGGAR